MFKRLLLVMMVVFTGLILSQLPGQASTTSVTPLPVGFEGMRFTANSQFNVVAHVTITADAGGSTLNAIFLYNNGTAQEGSDLAAGQTKLWVVHPDSGGFSTSTAQLVGSFTYYPNPGQFWEFFPDKYIENGSGLYITVDVTSSPTENASLAMYFAALEMEFDNSTYLAPASDAPASPPTIYLTNYTPPVSLQLGSTSLGQPSLSTGQTFSALEFNLNNVQTGLTGPVYLQGITITVRDGSGNLIAPDRALSSLGIRDSVTDTLMAVSTTLPSTPGGVYLPFAQSNTVMASFDRQIKVFGTVTSNTTTAVSSFTIELNSAQDLDALYLYTLNPVPKTAAPPQTFPLRSNVYQIGFTATSLQVYHTPVMAQDEVVIQGQPNVNPLNFTFINPGDTQTSRVDVTHLTLTLTDQSGNTLSPASMFSRVAIAGNVNYGELTSLPDSSGAIIIPMNISYIPVAVYHPVTVSVVADILPTAAGSGFILSLQSSISVLAQDSNRQIPVTISQAYASDSFPMSSHTIRIASSFSITSQSLAPPTLYPNQSQDVLSLTITHPGPSTTGPLEITGITITASDREDQPVNLGDQIKTLWITTGQGAILAMQPVTTTGASCFIPMPAYNLQPNTSVTLIVRLLGQAQFTASTLKVSVRQSDDLAVRLPQDPTRSIYIGATWPLVCSAMSLGGGEGTLYLSNYPNPFAAGYQQTSIAFYLKQSCTVSIKLFTLTGDQVRTLVNNEFRSAGEHQLTWDGRTRSGQAVKNGVYLLRLEALPVASGDKMIQLRKIAVVK